MSTPFINIKAQPILANCLAKTLQRTVDDLDELDGKKDGSISMDRISQADAFKDKILRRSGANVIPVPEGGYKDNQTYSAGELRPITSFLIDNGDNKIGKGDLFLDFDWAYKVNTGKGKQYAFRFALLFEKAPVADGFRHRARNESALPEGAWELKKQVELNRGKSLQFIRSIFRDFKYLPNLRLQPFIHLPD